MKKIRVTIKGITPLLQNRFLQAEIEGDSKKKSGAEPKKDFTDKLYLDANGKVYQPATHLIGCLINAGKSFQIRGKGKSTYSKLFGSSLDIQPEQIVHKNQKYEQFITTAVNPNTKGRVVLIRPLLRDWELTFELMILDDGIPAEVVKEVLDHGGRYVGIGDWRPDKKGKYGQFTVTEFKKL